MQELSIVKLLDYDISIMISCESTVKIREISVVCVEISVVYVEISVVCAEISVVCAEISVVLTSFMIDGKRYVPTCRSYRL